MVMTWVASNSIYQHRLIVKVNNCFQLILMEVDGIVTTASKRSVVGILIKAYSIQLWHLPTEVFRKIGVSISGMGE
jgi:hypothetical protein